MSSGPLLKKRPKSRLYPRKPNLQRRTPKYGEMWVWISFAPEYRLTLGSLVGGHNLATARKIIHQTRVKLDGNIPLFTTTNSPIMKVSFLRLITPGSSIHQRANGVDQRSQE